MRAIPIIDVNTDCNCTNYNYSTIVDQSHTYSPIA